MAYLYLNIFALENATVTLCVSSDDYDHKKHDVKDVNPKIGLVWKLASNVAIRTAVFRTTKPALVADATIQPTQIAGFNQFFDDINATKAWFYGAGLDARIATDLSAGAEASRRNLSQPTDGTRADPGNSLSRLLLLDS